MKNKTNLQAKTKMSISKIVSMAFLASLVTTVNAVKAHQQTDIQKALNNPNRPAAEVTLDKARKPEQVLEFFQIKKGMNVLDSVDTQR